MKKIQYLMNLTPEKRMVAGMMIIISFLVTERSIKEYKDSNYRNAKENQISEMQEKNAAKIITLYNKIIDGQTTRWDLMDSAVKQSSAAVKDVKAFLEKQKK